jgi:hypothetical protein
MGLRSNETRFVRVMVLTWLVTWVLADPLYLLQSLNAQDSPFLPYPVLKQEQTEKNYFSHRAESALSTSTKDDTSRKNGVHFVSSAYGNLREHAPLTSVRRTVTQPGARLLVWLAASISPRAPPSLSC